MQALALNEQRSKPKRRLLNTPLGRCVNIDELNMSKITTIEEFRQALAEDSFSHIDIKSGKFLQGAVAEKREDVRQILLDVAAQPVTDLHSRLSVKSALHWLADYGDPALIPFFLPYLANADVRSGAVGAIIISINNGALQPGDPLVVAALLQVLPDPVSRTEIIDTLSAVHAVQAIDVLVPYLNDADLRVREAAIGALGFLSSLTARRDVVDMLAALLESAEYIIRLKAATTLSCWHEDRFGDLDLRSYFESGP
jgi:HEAT repeat protein